MHAQFESVPAMTYAMPCATVRMRVSADRSSGDYTIGTIACAHAHSANLGVLRGGGGGGVKVKCCRL